MSRQHSFGKASTESDALIGHGSVNAADDLLGGGKMVDVHDDAGSPQNSWFAAATILTTLPMFMGYASLVSFQEKVRDRLGIVQKSDAAYVFGVATSLLFVFALVFRLLHNLLLGWMLPRHRVMSAYVMMFFSNAITALVVYALDKGNLATIFITYIVGGIAIGTFEVNIVSFVTPLGDKAKKWALLGMPLGYNGMAIGGFAIFALVPNSPTAQGLMFAFIGGFNLAGLVFFAYTVPNVTFESSKDNPKTSWAKLRRYREWLPSVASNCVCLFCDMFSCILASTISLYVFDANHVALWPGASATISKNAFQVVFNIGGGLGDGLSRMTAYTKQGTVLTPASGNPVRFMILTAIGLGLCLCKVCIAAPIGFFLIMFGNGSIYATTTRHIDSKVDPEFNLVVMSVWLFTGDLGSIIASNTVTPLRDYIGKAS